MMFISYFKIDPSSLLRRRMSNVWYMMFISYLKSLLRRRMSNILHMIFMSYMKIDYLSLLLRRVSRCGRSWRKAWIGDERKGCKIAGCKWFPIWKWVIGRFSNRRWAKRPQHGARLAHRSVSESRGGTGESAPTGVPAPSALDAGLRTVFAKWFMWWKGRV